MDQLLNTPKHGQEHYWTPKVTETRERFGEYVGYHGLRRDMMDGDTAGLNELPCEVILYVDVFRSRVKD